MNLKAQRKLNWLKQVGGDEAISALGTFVEKASEYAEVNNIPYKEHGENNMNQDALDMVEVPDISAEGFVEKEETETLDLNESFVNLAIDVEKETTETVNTNPVAITDEVPERLITIDTFVNEVFEPLMVIVKELREQNVDLITRLNALEARQSVMKEVQEDLEIVPAASVASLIKERLTNKLDGFIVTKESVAETKLVEQKPVENLSKSSDNYFDGFVNGF
jgi:BMFP domain-containing protein YqiC